MGYRTTQLLFLGNRPYRFTVGYNYRNRRIFFPSTQGAIIAHHSLHTALWPPLVFAQLLLALWAYKVCYKQARLNMVQCLMMIIFQNKLIYLPYIPYGARKETIQDYVPQLLGFDWTTLEINTRDDKKLTTCVAEIRFVQLHASTLLMPLETK
jgi:uncharacterized protein